MARHCEVRRAGAIPAEALAVDAKLRAAVYGVTFDEAVQRLTRMIYGIGAVSVYTSTAISTGPERRSLSRKLTLAAFAMLAQACQQPERGLGNIPHASAPQGREAMPEPVARTSGTRLSYWGVGIPPRQGPVGGAAARLGGMLSRFGGCLVVTAPNGIQVQPVFPAGKAVWDEASGILIFDGRSYRPGDRIEFGGGTVSSPSAYARETGVELAPCAVGKIWAVIA